MAPADVIRAARQTLQECLDSMVGQAALLTPDGDLHPDEACRIKRAVAGALLDAYGEAPELGTQYDRDRFRLTMLYHAEDGSWRGLQDWIDERETERHGDPRDGW